MAANGLLSWARRPDVWAGFTMLVFAALFVTPYCNYLFQCGCTWAWAGLDADCNVHHADPQYSCPWCASLVAGGASMVVLFGATYLAAVTGAGSSSTLGGYAKGVARGLAGFFVAGFLTAWAAALYTGYPMFVIPALV